MARKAYGLERLVHIDFEEAYIRIYQDGRVIVRADGTLDELEELYTQAALRLTQWLQLKGET